MNPPSERLVQAGDHEPSVELSTRTALSILRRYARFGLLIGLGLLFTVFRRRR